MTWVCGRELAGNEYLWDINPNLPHEHGEPQDDGNVEYPCDCTPVEISDEEFDRRRQAKLDEVEQYL